MPFFNWWPLRAYSVPFLYGCLVKGDITKAELIKKLRVSQVSNFIELHRRVTLAMEGNGDLPVEVVIQLTQAFLNRRRLAFALIQVDIVIEDLERRVAGLAGNTNIIKRVD